MLIFVLNSATKRNSLEFIWKRKAIGNKSFIEMKKIPQLKFKINWYNMTKQAYILAAFLLSIQFVIAQTSTKLNQNFGKPVITDSNSTLMIPVLIDAGLFSASKLTVGGDYCSNIIFYNFKKDTYKKLFNEDVYILSLDRSYYYLGEHRIEKNMTSKLIFYRVVNFDRNENKKIDNEDPAVLFVSDTHGDGVRMLSSVDENVVDIQIFENQNMALVKMQRDANNDKNFTIKDNDFYFVKLDLSTLKFGEKIELK